MIFELAYIGYDCYYSVSRKRTPVTVPDNS